MAEKALTRDERERALAYARKQRDVGHHHSCASRSRRKCDCYYGRGDYLVARRLLELEGG